MHWIRRASWHLEGTESGLGVTGDKVMKSSPILEIRIGRLTFKYGHVRSQWRISQGTRHRILSGANGSFRKSRISTPHFPHGTTGFSNHSKLAEITVIVDNTMASSPMMQDLLATVSQEVYLRTARCP